MNRRNLLLNIVPAGLLSLLGIQTASAKWPKTVTDVEYNAVTHKWVKSGKFHLCQEAVWDVEEYGQKYKGIIVGIITYYYLTDRGAHNCHLDSDFNYSLWNESYPGWKEEPIYYIKYESFEYPMAVPQQSLSYPA